MNGEITIDRNGTLTFIDSRGERLVVAPTAYTMDLMVMDGILRLRFTVKRHERYGRFDVDVDGREARISYAM